MWIELLAKTKQGEIGTQLPVAEGGEVSAKALIEAEVAKEIPEPASVAKAARDAGGQIQSFLEKSVTKGFESLTASLAPAMEKFKHAAAGYELGSEKALRLPATAKRFSSVKNFKEGRGMSAETKAYYFGAFVMALRGKSWAMKRLKEAGLTWNTPFGDDGESTDNLNGTQGKAAAENLNSDSSILVPEQFGDDIIDLREKFGVFRQHSKIVPMTSDTRIDPRRRDGVACYFVGEGVAGTQADKTWDNVRLTARKLMALTKYSTEVSEDAVINIGDDLAEEFAYAFALTEDKCGFIGDGTSTYGGMRGVNARLKGVDATIANIAGLTVATGSGYASSYGSIVLSDFNKVVGTLPEYAEQRDPDCGWYVSKFFWGSVMQKLATAAGGNRVENIVDGALQKRFLGYPVRISQVMPKTPAINQVCALLGSLKLASSFGTRREIGISVSNSALNAFEQDQLVMRGTERFFINVHDVGDSTAAGLAASAQAGAVAGPVVGLITSAS